MSTLIGINTRHQLIKIRKVWQYIFLVLLVLAMLVPSAILPAPVEASPSAPTLVSPANETKTTNVTPTLDWTSVSGASSYEWQTATSSGFSPVYSSGTTISHSYTFSSPLYNSDYWWRVRAKDAAGNASGWSTVWKFHVVAPPQLVSPPDGSYFDLIIGGLIRLRWTDLGNSYTGVGYSVQIYKDSSLEFNDWLDSEGDYFYMYYAGRYSWRVQVHDNGLTSDWSPFWHFNVAVAVLDDPVLASPPDKATCIGIDTPTLKWNAVSGASKYEWEIANNASFSPIYCSGITTSTSYTFPSPLPYGLYYWRVMAFDDLGNHSNWSTVWSFSLTGYTTLIVSPATGIFGDRRTLAAALTKASNNTPVTGKSIAFTLNGASVGSATTDASGVAFLYDVSLSGIPVGTYPAGIGASFAGDGFYGASSGTAQLDVLSGPVPLQSPPPPPSGGLGSPSAHQPGKASTWWIWLVVGMAGAFASAAIIRWQLKARLPKESS